MKKAVFLDRDGVINVDKGYVYRKKDFRFCSGVFDTLRYLQSLDYELFIITNQSGIGRDYYTFKDFALLSFYMLKRLKKENIFINEIYFCPHAPEEKCQCRKPNPFMINKACQKYNINPQKSIMVGDKLSDVDCGKNANIRSLFLIGEQKGEYFTTIQKISNLKTFINF